MARALANTPASTSGSVTSATSTTASSSARSPSPRWRLRWPASRTRRAACRRRWTTSSRRTPGRSAPRRSSEPQRHRMPATSTPGAADANSCAAKPPWLRRALNAGLIVVYCLAIFFALDLAYTTLIFEKERVGRIAHEHYHHGLMANFDGYELWGRSREKLFTNNLGFKDSRVRDVPAVADSKRVVLIGDSFVEGVGLKFEDTFAGMLYQAGQQRA